MSLGSELVKLAESQVVQVKRDAAINALSDAARELSSPRLADTPAEGMLVPIATPGDLAELCATAARTDLPADFLVLDGAFEVKEEAGNKFLELPGAPLETFGVLFGPTEKDGLSVGVRIFGTLKGRRFPAFGAGLSPS